MCNNNCNFTCTCINRICECNHFIEDINNRIILKELFEKYYKLTYHNIFQIVPDDIRNKSCFFKGHICYNQDCNFNHYC